MFRNFIFVIVVPMNELALVCFINLVIKTQWIYQPIPRISSSASFNANKIYAIIINRNARKKMPTDNHLLTRMLEKNVRIITIINPFQSSVSFLYPLKTSEKRFQGVQKCDTGLKLVNTNQKNKIQRKFEYYFFSCLTFEITSIKQKTLNKQGSMHKSKRYN